MKTYLIFNNGKIFPTVFFNEDNAKKTAAEWDKTARSKSEIRCVDSEPLSCTTEDIITKDAFSCICLSREDFDSRGFDASGLTPERMQRIADKIGDVLMEGGDYWSAIDYWGEYEKMPRLNKSEETIAAYIKKFGNRKNELELTNGPSWIFYDDENNGYTNYTDTAETLRINQNGTTEVLWFGERGGKPVWEPLSDSPDDSADGFIEDLIEALEEEFGELDDDDTTLEDILEKDIYSIEDDGNGGKQIHIAGWFYKSANAGADRFRCGEYSFLIVPLGEFVKNYAERGQAYIDELQSSAKLYEGDMTAKDVRKGYLNYFSGKKPQSCLPYDKITVDTPVGTYHC